MGIAAKGLVELLVDLFSFFEPIAPSFASLYIRRRLNRLRDSGLISDYKSRIKRVGRMHYLITVDLELTGKQADGLLAHLLRQRSKRR